MSEFGDRLSRRRYFEDFHYVEPQTRRQQSKPLPVRRTQYDWYGDGIHSPDYIKNASGLVMPGSVEQAAEMVRQNPYVLVHHFGNFLTLGERMLREGKKCSLLDVAIAYREELKVHEPSILTWGALKHGAGMTQDLKALNLSGLDHTYTEDIQGNLDALLAVYDAFLDGLAEQGKLIIGINNSLDPFCTGYNLSAIGNHCHLGWMNAREGIDKAEPVNNSDTYKLLAPVRWYVYTQLAERHPEIEAGVKFLRDMYDGRISIYVESAQLMGTTLDIPEVHLDIDLYRQFTGRERFMYEQYLFNPTGLTNGLWLWRDSLPHAHALADDIEQNVTLNNFQQYIAEY